MCPFSNLLELSFPVRELQLHSNPFCSSQVIGIRGHLLSDFFFPDIASVQKKERQDVVGPGGDFHPPGVDDGANPEYGSHSPYGQREGEPEPVDAHVADDNLCLSTVTLADSRP